MTRKSRREIEQAVEELTDGAAGSDDVRAWVDAYIQETVGDGFSIDHGGADDGEPTVHIATAESRGSTFYFHAPESDLPEWVDAETDLPVRA
jgi:hypothetical protein